MILPSIVTPLGCVLWPSRGNCCPRYMGYLFIWPFSECLSLKESDEGCVYRWLALCHNSPVYWVGCKYVAVENVHRWATIGCILIWNSWSVPEALNGKHVMLMCGVSNQVTAILSIHGVCGLQCFSVRFMCRSGECFVVFAQFVGERKERKVKLPGFSSGLFIHLSGNLPGVQETVLCFLLLIIILIIITIVILINFSIRLHQFHWRKQWFCI